MGLACSYVSLRVVKEPCRSMAPKDPETDKTSGPQDPDLELHMDLERPQSTGSAATRGPGRSLDKRDTTCLGNGDKMIVLRV